MAGTPGRAKVAFCLKVMLWLVVSSPGSSAITLVVPSGCTSIEPASYTCGDLRKLKTQISLDELSSCDKARITCRGIGSFVDCYIFPNDTSASRYKRFASLAPDKGTFITGCGDAQICDMPFTPSEVRKTTENIYLVTYASSSSNNRGVNISAECLTPSTSTSGPASTPLRISVPLSAPFPSPGPLPPRGGRALPEAFYVFDG